MQQPARARLKAPAGPPMLDTAHEVNSKPLTQVQSPYLQSLEGEGCAVGLGGSQVCQHHQRSGTTKVTPTAHHINHHHCKQQKNRQRRVSKIFLERPLSNRACAGTAERIIVLPANVAVQC